VNGRIDLLPSDCRVQFMRRSRVRRWIGLYVGGVALLLGSHAWVNLGRGALEAEHAALTRQARENWERNEEAQELVGEIRDMGNMIARYNRLAWPVRVSDAINVISGVIPDSTTLTAMTLTPRQERTRIGSGKDRREETTTYLAIELEGLAPDDLAVAQVVSGLDGHPLFSTVTLDFARSREVDGVTAREFRVNCEIDLSRRYALASAPAGREGP